MSKDSTGAFKGTDRRTVLKTAGATAAIGSLAGCAGIAGDEDTGSLTVGHIGPEGSPLGVGSVRTAEMARDRINNGDNLDTTGVLDDDVTLETKDTLASPSEAQTAVEELINQDDVDVIVGGFASEVARQVIELTSEFDVPYLSTGPADPRLSTNFVGDDYDSYKHYFRVGPLNSELQAEGMADYCAHLSDLHGWNSLTFYRDNAAWTEVYGNTLPGLLEDEGLTVEASDAITIDGPDLSPMISQTRNSNADYILRFFAHIQNSASQLLGPWHEAQYDFGVEGIHVSGMHPEFDALTEGVCVYETTSQTGAGGAAAITENTQPFVQSYREYSGGESPAGHPMYMGFGTYDAMLLLQDVVNSVGTADLAGNLDDFVDDMLSTEPGRIPAVAGDLQFYDPDGPYPHDLQAQRADDGQIENFPVTQWQPNDGDRPGQIECVYPESFQSAEHVRPAWMQ